jgi:two-component system, chemotaxis family, chemotaxis protein CheY
MAKIMIVDDASFMRLSIRRMLEKYDFDVIAEAVDGEDAVEKFKTHKPDLITMDVTMPKMTGIEALKAIKKIDSSVKIVMVTAMGQESLIKEAVLSGANSFIVKPFKEEKLVEVLLSMTK